MEHAFYLVFLISPAPETLLLSRKIPPPTRRTLGTMYLVLRGNGVMVSQVCVKVLTPAKTSATKSPLGAGHPKAQNTCGKPW
jgi:hypothetical protein